ncbi:uncharacterized protein LOC123273641 [Cotesia glomerata]|uniref:uncharacterized protein LOC123273641 n=1 Tax=Cotesia glomerata TaxID=32391 RepID=UPI001D02EA69|nr:uncharacterized protein LOC123273641 [Cotesia glomerata]
MDDKSSTYVTESTKARIRAHHEKIWRRIRWECPTRNLDDHYTSYHHVSADNRASSCKIKFNNRQFGPYTVDSLLIDNVNSAKIFKLFFHLPGTESNPLNNIISCLEVEVR